MDDQFHVLIVGDSRFFNEAIGDLIKAQKNFNSTILMMTSDEVFTKTPAYGFDLILVDAKIRVPPVVDLIRNLRASSPESKVIALGVEQEELLEIIEAGAHGYVLNEHSFAEVMKTIEAVQRKQTRCSSQIALSVFNRISALSCGRGESNGKLTQREQEILSLIAAGLSNKDISRQLRITLCTVKNHVHSILTKLQVRRRQDAIRYASSKEAAQVVALLGKSGMCLLVGLQYNICPSIL